MSKVVKKVNWTSPTGKKIEVVIAVEKKVTRETSYADGWNIDLGSKIYYSKDISVYADGKFVERTSENPEVVQTGLFTEDTVAKIKAAGGYAKLTFRVVINEENYNLVMAAISEAEAELEALFAAENPEAIKEEEAKKKAETEAQKQKEIKWAERILKEVKNRQDEILSDEEEAKWRKHYNDVCNEGGEGYVPQRATLEDVARAIDILGYKKTFGTVEFEGKQYTLTGNADFTDRLLPGPWNLHEVNDGEEYQFEMSAPAIDEQGKEYKVTWIFWGVKGEELQLEDLDYDKVYSVEAV